MPQLLFYGIPVGSINILSIELREHNAERVSRVMMLKKHMWRLTGAKL